MGFPQPPSTSPPDYSQSLQLKLYQAFIFSIPILFSVILFLLFYMFYLKRRTSATVSTLQPTLTLSLNQSFFISSRETGLKGNLKDKLPVILFDEELLSKDSMCCVCLGEFEIKEEVHQIPVCRHVFHADCLRCWLPSNPTCPLCRSFIFPTAVRCGAQQPALALPEQVRQDNQDFNYQSLHITSPVQQEDLSFRVNLELTEDNSTEHHIATTEGSNPRGNSNQDSVVLSIQTDQTHDG
ncbi:hypothetical protein NMG60_11026922 [Bertholletia excelsa]